MDTDDGMVGRLLSRREILALIGVAGVGAIAARASAQSRAAHRALGSTGAPIQGMPACVVRPAQTEGPYFVDEKLNRADIRSDPASGDAKPGVPLDLEIRVARVGSASCAPLAGAMVDIWQCDAVGVYSDVADTNGLFNTKGQKFLRGYQLTDASGVARFRTIYPGWYQGRTVHVHFKIRTTPNGGRAHEFTSQLYFDDAVSDDVLARAPYVNAGRGRVRNDRDGIFRSQGGQNLILAVAKKGDGYAGTFDIGMNIG
jgi:protocatechuate 3,4-dioxygenase beta subunit